MREIQLPAPDAATETTVFELISINILEFAVEIINDADISIWFINNKSLTVNDFPLLVNWTDNMSAKSWIKKVALKSYA